MVEIGIILIIVGLSYFFLCVFNPKLVLGQSD
jgi:hypothetical protein